MDNLILIAMWAVGLLIAFIIIGAAFATLYKRATKELAFVRTGFGGEHVVINGGAIILPVVHGTIEVNMNTLRLEVRRTNEQALITKDRMRVDVTAEFYVRVQPSRESIANAAQTLGAKTMEPNALKELVEGKFVDALRAVAAGMKMEELHEQRVDFVSRVQTAVSEDLLKNGLELESVSLTGLDQTNREYFNPDNVFDAEGLTIMTRQIEERKKIRNDIEQETQVQIAQKNLDAQSTRYSIEREQEAVRLENERQTEEARAQQGLQISKARETARQQTRAAEIATEQAISTADITAKQNVQKAQITSEQTIKAEQIQADQAVELSSQESKIAIAKKSEETSLADAAAAEARAKAVEAEERIVTARQTEIAQREKTIELIEASKQAEQQAVGITVAAEAERKAAENRAEAIKTVASGEAEATIIRANAAAKTYEVDAEGQSKLNAAANSISPEQREMQVKLRLIETMPSIIAESVKPLESIDGIKIVQMNGSPFGATGAAGENGNAGNGASSIANAALQYRGQAPLIDALLSEIGLNGGSLDGLTASLVPAKAAESTPASAAKPNKAPKA